MQIPIMNIVFGLQKKNPYEIFFKCIHIIGNWRIDQLHFTY